MPKVSVLLPVFNNRDDIGNAIQSVFDQTFTDWELIIIDDATTDGTIGVIEKTISENPNRCIRLIRNSKNYGVYVSLNKAIQASTGEYIVRLDSDDTFTPTYLEQTSKFLDENPDKIAVRTMSQIVGQPPKYGEITLVYRKTLIDSIGYYDSVRFSADSEFRERLYKRHSLDIGQVEMISYIVKERQGSLSRGSVTSNVVVRLRYIANYRQWHATAEKLYVDFPMRERLWRADDIQVSSYNPDTDQ